MTSPYSSPLRKGADGVWRIDPPAPAWDVHPLLAEAEALRRENAILRAGLEGIAGDKRVIGWARGMARKALLEADASKGGEQ